MRPKDDTHPQLWNAGPVKILARSHRQGAPPVQAKCAEPGCNNMRRLKQGARYCDEHARSKDYVYAGRAPTETRTCTCGRNFDYTKRLVSAAAQVWDEFCPDCHTSSPLSLKRLRSHNVPDPLIRKWLTAGAQLKCDLCGKTLTRRHLAAKPVIDHDHTHCPDGNSCGLCVRGVVCWDCNTKIGHIENAIRADLLGRILKYIAHPT